MGWAVSGGAAASDGASRADFASRSLAATVSALRTIGYAAPGDGGAALYKRVSSQPVHAGKFQSADGAWWELAETAPCWRMFGAKGDDSADDTPAIRGAIAFANLKGLTLAPTPGVYRYRATSAQAITCPIRGAGKNETIVKVNASGFTGAVFHTTDLKEVGGFSLRETSGSLSGTGIYVAAADPANFQGGGALNDVHVLGFDKNVAFSNVYRCSLINCLIEYGNEGLYISPVRDPAKNGGDNGYYTNILIRDSIIQYNARNVYANSTGVGRQLTFWDTIIQDPTGSEQSQFYKNADVKFYTAYFEGGASVPAITIDNSTIQIDHGYMNATGGIDLGSRAGRLMLNNIATTSQTDTVVATGTAGKSVIIENADLPALNVTSDFQLYRNSTIGGVYHGWEVLAQAAGLAVRRTNADDHSNPLINLDSYVVTAPGQTVPAHGAVVVRNDYRVNALREGEATATPLKSQAGLIFTASPDPAGNPEFVRMVVHNVTASPITMPDTEVRVSIRRFAS